jgi:hypothetical protein
MNEDDKQQQQQRLTPTGAPVDERFDPPKQEAPADRRPKSETAEEEKPDPAIRTQEPEQEEGEPEPEEEDPKPRAKTSVKTPARTKHVTRKPSHR